VKTNHFFKTILVFLQEITSIAVEVGLGR